MTHIVQNPLLPFGEFLAINLFGIVFTRKRRALTPQAINHERIHTAQMREMLYVPFYLWYVAEWVLRLVQCRSPRQAYFGIRFEREAYVHGDDLAYLGRRRRFAWFRDPQPPLFLNKSKK